MSLATVVLHRNGTGLTFPYTSPLCSDSVVAGVKGNVPSDVEQRSNCFPIGMIVDNAFDTNWLSTMDKIRCSLPLDSKRPTVDRRFFADHSEERTIVGVIETTVKDIILKTAPKSSFAFAKPETESELFVYCNRYLRILEYTKPGGGLAPHTDGRKVCEETGIESTHTFLLFLSACTKGGQTALLDGKHGWSSQSQVVVPKTRIQEVNENGNLLTGPQLCDVAEGDSATNVSVGVSPRFGRVLFFPHEWPHAGALCDSVPKVMLRAELTIQWKIS